MNANEVQVVPVRAALRTESNRIEAVAVTKRYRGFQLGPITLSIVPGEAVALLGETCSGKSTLLRLLAGRVRPEFDPARAGLLCQRFAVDPTLLAGSFSRGQRLRALFVLALAHRSGVLLVDEGTAGLDVATRRDTLSQLDGLRRDEGLAIVFSSHLPEDTEILATRRILLEAGQIVHDTRRTRLGAR